MYQHTISYGGRSYNVTTPTHVDDHPTDDDWVKRNAHYIKAAANIATVVGVLVKLKPRR